MTIMVRERPIHAASPVVFLAVTPQIRRALSLLAEAAIDLLDEIDRPAEGLEPDPDAFEDADPAEEDDAPEEDDFPEDGHDAEEEEGDGDLGWPERICQGDGVIGLQGDDCDIVEAETSGGFRPVRLDMGDGQNDAGLRALFDPRLSRRSPDGRAGYAYIPASIPTFPNEPADRPRFDGWSETRRLASFLAQAGRKRRRRR